MALPRRIQKNHPAYRIAHTAILDAYFINVILIDKSNDIDYVVERIRSKKDIKEQDITVWSDGEILYRGHYVQPATQWLARLIERKNLERLNPIQDESIKVDIDVRIKKERRYWFD